MGVGVFFACLEWLFTLLRASSNLRLDDAFHWVGGRNPCQGVEPLAGWGFAGQLAVFGGVLLGVTRWWRVAGWVGRREGLSAHWVVLSLFSFLFLARRVCSLCLAACVLLAAYVFLLAA